MFGIQEFSRLSQISVMMLSYYANAGILEPGWIDPLTGKRYYLTEQVKAAEKINMFRNFGFSVSEISVIHRDWNDESMIGELCRKKSELEAEIRQRGEKIKLIDQHIERMAGAVPVDTETVKLKKLPKLQIYSVRMTEHLSRSEMLLWNKLKQCMEKQELPEKGTYLMINYGNEFKDQTNDGELGLIVEEEIQSETEAACRVIPAAEAVCCRVMGGEEKLRGAYVCIADWLARNEKYKMCDSVRKVYKKKSEHTKGAEQKIIELQIQVSRII